MPLVLASRKHEAGLAGAQALLVLNAAMPWRIPTSEAFERSTWPGLSGIAQAHSQPKRMPENSAIKMQMQLQMSPL